MNVKVICVGKIKEPYVRKLIERCVKAVSYTHLTLPTNSLV